MLRIVEIAISVAAAAFFVVFVLVPIVDDATTGEIIGWKHVDGDSGVRMAYMDLTAPHENTTVNIALSDGVLSLTGDYEASVDGVDQIVSMSDTSSVFVQNGVMYHYNGTTLEQVSEITVSVEGANVNGTPSAWVYIPAKDGIYSSYNSGYDSEPTGTVAAVGTFAGVTLQSKGDAVTSSNPYNLSVTVDSDESGVYGVSYGVSA